MSQAAELQTVVEKSAWKASDFTARRQWARPFTPEMLEEIDRAIRDAAARNIPYRDITRENFPLPKAAALLEEARVELDEGPGFTVLSEFPVERYSYDENVLAYCGISAYLGQIADQTHKRDKLQDVIDKGLPYDATSRAYRSNKFIPFHTDGCDVTGLMCLQTAAVGGESLIVSTAAIYNEIRQSRPDVLEILFRGFRYHRRGEQPPGEPPVSAHYLPVFSFHEGLFSGAYNRYPIEWAQQEIGALSAAEIEALDVFDAVATRPDMHMSMDFKRGDMQYVNNHVVLHSRTEYSDDEAHRRHLVRIWLNIPNSRRQGITTVTLYAPWSQRDRKAS